MALNSKTSIASRDLALNAAFDVLNSGYLKIYNGTQPENPDDPIDGPIMLAQLSLSSTAFAAASDASKAANAITAATAVATGTATWFSLVTAGGSRVFDGNIGTTGSNNLNLNSVAISAGATVAVSALTMTQAE